MERSRIAKGRVPSGLVGMIALVLVAEGFVARRSCEFSDAQSYSWRFGGRAARERRANVEVLCLGDSLVKLGVLPRVLEARLGRSAFNLSLIGGQAPSTYFLLRRVLESGGRPRAIVVDFHPDLLASAPKSSEPYWSDLVDLREGIDLSWTSRDPGLGLATFSSWLVPSIKGRYEIRAGLSAALRGESSATLRDRRALRHNWRVNGGAQVAAPPALPPDDSGFVGKGGSHRRWAPHRANVAYVRRFLDLASSYDIAVFWLIPPTIPSWQSWREGLGVDQPYERFIRSMTVRCPKVTVLDGRRAGYQPPVFVDPTHMNRDGAIALSDATASLMAAFLTGGRSTGSNWTAIPPFRGHPGGTRIEDLQQSRMALEGPEDRPRR